MSKRVRERERGRGRERERGREGESEREREKERERHEVARKGKEMKKKFLSICSLSEPSRNNSLEVYHVLTFRVFEILKK